MRVLGFTQNDSHIYCTEEQAVEEFVNVMKLHEFFYKTLGITKYHLELALRDPKNTKKYHGNEEMWQKAEKLMREAVAQTNIPMVETVGSAAFYGPKIDFIIHSSIGREFAISTNQLDLFMGPRFKLKYIDRDGSEKVPAIIHRAPLGSHERFIGFLLEHFAGALPVWLTPVQAKVLPITDKQIDYSRDIVEALTKVGIRVEIDDRSETLQAKIRDAQLEKIPYMFILGPREEEAHKVSLRLRNGEDRGAMDTKEAIFLISRVIEDKSLDLE
jgi:threonyl-tRNA synthetase